MGALVFADTSGLVAKFLEGDPYHPKAAPEMETLLRKGKKFLTTDFIFDEVVTLVRSRAGHANAVRAGDHVLDSRVLEFAEIDSGIKARAWKIFKKCKEHNLSFTDCTSFAVMEEYNIVEAFTFDTDFKKMGYTVLPSQ